MLLFAALSVASRDFLSFGNIMNVLSQVAVVAIIAAGMTFVILTGGIDLSVGSILGLSGILAAAVVKGNADSMPTYCLIPLAIAVCLGTGLALGVANGYLVAYQKLPAFVATLGMMSIARSLGFIYTQGKPISIFPPEFRWIATHYIGGAVPVIAFFIVAVFAASWFVLNQRPFGRYIYAIGSNENATRLSGIDTSRYQLAAYAICGLLTGLAALLAIGRINSAHPGAGASYEMNAIAAVVIGGTSLSGGSGAVGGTLIGALIMGLISNGLNLRNVDAFWQGVVLGAVIILAVLVDVKSRSRGA